MKRDEFESRLSDYVRDELSPAEAGEIETHLEAHPEASDDLEAVRTVVELGADIGAAEPPEALFAAARAKALEAIRAEAEEERKSQRTGLWGRLPRPVYLSGLAAVLAAVVVGVLWQDASTPAWADVAARAGKLQSVRVVGWVRGERGEQVPVKQWIKAPHFFRVLIGTGAARREVVAAGAKMRVYLDGAWYEKEVAADYAWSTDKIAGLMSLPEHEERERWSYREEREDRGETVLFSIWRASRLGTKNPSDIRYEVEADSRTRLPRHARVFLDVGQEEWELVSELKYLDYDAPLADELFAVAADTVRPHHDAPLAYELFPVAPDAVRPLPSSASKADPFGGMRMVPFVPWNRAFFMPLNGMDIIVHPPSDDPGKGKEGHASSTAGGVTRLEFHRTPLAEIVRKIGEMPVEPRVKRTVSGVIPDSGELPGEAPEETPEQEWAGQRYSARISYSHRLTPMERVQRLGRRFGFAAAAEERQGTRTRWVFSQDGSGFPTNPQMGGSGTTGDSYHATGYPLGFAIPGMLENAALNDLVEGYDRDLDEIEMQWDGPAADNPFERQVDIDVDFSGGWNVALEYLREQFGVRMEHVSEPVSYEVLVLRPHGGPAK